MEFDKAMQIISTLSMMTAMIYLSFTTKKIVGELVNALDSQRLDFSSLLMHSVDTIKAKSLAERALAESEEKRSDIQVEMLKDAWAVEKESGINVDPIYARTDAGKEINIREYDIL